jgi:hypothetical protein
MERFVGGSQPTDSVLLACGDWQLGVISTRYRTVLCRMASWIHGMSQIRDLAPLFLREVWSRDLGPCIAGMQACDLI